MVTNVNLENGDKNIFLPELYVGNLASTEDMIIGLDLFQQLNLEIKNLAILPPTKQIEEKPKIIKQQLNTNFPPDVNEQGIAKDWEKVIEDNKKISTFARCEIIDSDLSINTGDAQPIWINQYPIPQGYHKAVDDMIVDMQRRKRAHFDYAVVASFTPNPSLDGKNIAQINVESGRAATIPNEIETILDMVKLGSASMVFHSMNEADVDNILKYNEV